MTITSNRHEEALRLRNQGWSYSRIARELGYGPYPSAARYAVLSAMREQTRNVPVQHRQFGVEIEFYGITPRVAIAALTEAGIEASYEGYTHRVMDGWKIVTDGSVTSRGTGTGSGLELVSPILAGERGLESVEKALNALVTAGAKVNTTCGLHVHVDTNDMDDETRSKFFLLWVKNQDQIDRLVSQSRRNNRSYCRRYEENHVGNIMNQIQQGDYRQDRYRTLNIVSYEKYGTFEVRQHQGTLNSKKVVNWIRLILSIAKTATEMNMLDIAGTNSVDEFLTLVNAQEDVKRFWLRREAQLNRVAVAA